MSITEIVNLGTILSFEVNWAQFDLQLAFFHGELLA